MIHQIHFDQDKIPALENPCINRYPIEILTLSGISSILDISPYPPLSAMYNSWSFHKLSPYHEFRAVDSSNENLLEILDPH